ncbi:MAG TPA: XTP/dITP diphosphatase [Candidatus Thermoplasmatota archaeon]|jgi:XTP/dITP diphosphohydrolase|nr:XTP/dITP diphosphatase [Candidatus Thermoplasmatota archaeon]
MRLAFVTGNAHKAREAQAALKPLGIDVAQRAIPHPEIQADTLEEVARERARFLQGHLDEPFIVDDAGLFVDALNGFPGVYSAYVNKTLGWQGVLKLLEGQPNRAARFEAVIAYMEPSLASPFLHKGVCAGRIVEAARGAQGFGFDPIFAAEDHDRTFAELTIDEKTNLSHRGRALAALARWLEGNRPSGFRATQPGGAHKL